jgi:two-component system, cell cycle sensor histidine kinase and response regulator CckA
LSEPVSDAATILVVEDVSDLRELFEEILRDAGYAVLSAPDGRAALELVRSHSGAIDLLLTDVRMPVMPGDELARRMRAENGDLKIIFMSGHADVVADGELPGASQLQKPFLDTELLEQVARSLGPAV